MTIRVRFAPSPTGYLHVGGARTALFNWLYARKNGGTFILRIEDTDLQRSTDESTRQIYESMKWLGLDWDEGPFLQSERGPLYLKELQRLIESGVAYRAFETPEELDAAREKAAAEKRNPIYDRASLRLSPEEVEAKVRAGVPYVWRFKCPPGKVTIPETLMTGGEAGNVMDSEELGDFVLTRATTGDQPPGMPLFNFVCAVDDALMGITHVIRGADHLTNTARQVLILQALGYPIPKYTHLPLITKNGKKMSKRKQLTTPEEIEEARRRPVAVHQRRELGYLPEATLNFIALLGWSTERETDIIPPRELVQKFSLEGLSKANPEFDEAKYDFINGWYIRNLPKEDIVERVKPFLAEAGLRVPAGKDDGWLGSVIGLEIERCKILSEFPDALRYFFVRPEHYEAAGAKKLFEKDGVAEILNAAADALEQSEPFDAETLEARMRALGEAQGLGFGKIAQPVRLATTGRTASPGLFDVLIHLGKEESVARIRIAADRIARKDVPLE